MLLLPPPSLVMIELTGDDDDVDVAVAAVDAVVVVVAVEVDDDEGCCDIMIKDDRGCNSSIDTVKSVVV